MVYHSWIDGSIITGVDRDCRAWFVRSFGMARVKVIIEGEAEDGGVYEKGNGRKKQWVHGPVRVADR